MSQDEAVQENVKVTLNVPTVLMRRFDELVAKLGYTRAEAIREAMRRFSDWIEEKVKQRPEEAVSTVAATVQAVMTPVIQMLKAYQALEIPEVPKLPSKSQNRGKVK